MKFRLWALYRNVVAGTRLALFLPVRAQDFRASAVDYAWLIAFNFGVWLVAAALRTGMAGEFDPAAPALYFGGVPLVLGTALVIARLFRAPERLLLIAVALTASDSLFELVALVVPAIAAWSGTPRLALLLLLAWLWAASVRAVVVCCGAQRPHVLKAALAVTAMLALAFFAFPRTDVWTDVGDEPDADALTAEPTFHLQGELIERALAAIQPGRPGVRELYFVGFAPDSSLDVFLHEMRFVRRLFDERFATAGHSIALVSSEDALDEFPIGSVTNLKRALTRVAQQMNGDEDVLFLYVTAHGDAEHRLSAVQPPLDLAPLTPTALARMLQDAGIKWRVIVVSACYSGGFIEPLRDDNSIVITASAADRTSFGCEAGRDFTYFGEAYFRDALERTRSFTEAFELARQAVGRQEADEKLTPSAPQMWVGRAIAHQLENAPDRPDQK